MKHMRELDLRIPNPERSREGKRTEDLIFRINQTHPASSEYRELVKKLFTGGFGEGSSIHPPFFVNLASNVHIGRNVSIMPYFRAMSAGRITIDDGAMIAMNTSIVTNNHDFYERRILTVADTHIGREAWIGTGSILLPGVTIGDYAVVGAGSIVTKDVPAYCVAAGNPARIIRRLDPRKFIQLPDASVCLQHLHEMESFRGSNHSQKQLRQWLEADFDNPDSEKSIHIAGTNGKGSAIAWLEALLGLRNLKTGSFISPHLEEHRERYRINGKPMDADLFFQGLEYRRDLFKERGLTMFEQDLWMALDHFQAENPDWTLIETGMGGDRDATTAMNYPYGIITSIGLDHMGLLGNTIEQIAQKKAGIIKPGMTIVSALQQPEAEKVLEEQAAAAGANLVFINPDRRVPEGLKALPAYQKENFLCAITLLEQAGFDFSDEELEEAVRRFSWPGRFDILRENPLIVLDGAHNQAGIEALCKSIEEKQLSFDRIFFSVLADKQADAMIERLQQICENILLVPFESGRLADLEQLAKKYSLPVLSLEQMMEQLDGPERSLICGSLYFCAEVLRQIHQAAEE